MNDYRPRITIEVTESQMRMLTQILPHGVKKPLFQLLVDGIIELHSRGGYNAIGALVAKQISISQLADLGINKSTNEKILELKNRLATLEDSNG